MGSIRAEAIGENSPDKQAAESRERRKRGGTSTCGCNAASDSLGGGKKLCSFFLSQALPVHIKTVTPCMLRSQSTKPVYYGYERIPPERPHDRNAMIWPITDTQVPSRSIDLKPGIPLTSDQDLHMSAIARMFSFRTYPVHKSSPAIESGPRECGKELIAGCTVRVQRVDLGIGYAL